MLNPPGLSGEPLVRRGVDVSAVYDGTTISFAHRVALCYNRLVIAE